MRIYVQALNNPNDNFLLLIEEINRANVASVFGDVFQLLDRKNGISEYPVATTEDIKKYLIKKLKCFKKKDSIGNESIKSFDEFSDDDIKKCMYMCIPSNGTCRTTEVERLCVNYCRSTSRFKKKTGIIV